MGGFTRRLGLKRFGGTLGGQISDDGYRFTNEDRQIIDSFLAALESHSHEGGSPLADPLGVPAVTLDTSDGLLSAGLTLYYRVSFVDAYGLETAASDEVVVTTPLPIDNPSAPALAVSGTSTNPPGSYAYAITYVTAEGEETLPSPVSVASVTSAAANVTLTFEGLPAGAVARRIYRKAPNESTLYLLAQQATGTFVDNGSYTPDFSRTTPTINNTNSTNRVLVEAPDLDVSNYLPSGVKAWRIYRAYASGQYGDAALVHEVVEHTSETDPTTPLVVTWYDAGEALRDGLPLDVSTTFKPPPAVPAGNFVFVPAGSGLQATTLQDAIVELAKETPECVNFALTGLVASTTTALKFQGIVTGWVVPDIMEGFVIDGLTTSSTTGPTAGSAVFRITVNGSVIGGTNLKTTLNVASGRKTRYKALTTDRVTLHAGDELSVQVVTDGTWAPANDVVTTVVLTRV